MSKYDRRSPPKPSKLAKGAAVVARGIPGPVMLVARHTQFDNGEVECVWFTPAGTVQRAWLPEDILAPFRVPFVNRKPELDKRMGPL